MAYINFNADENPTTKFEPIPVGDYLAVATESEMKETKNGGKRLSICFEIIEGEYKSRKVFGGFNLENANETAVKIAKSELGDFCRAVGISHPKDSSELHGKPVKIRLAIKPAEGQYDASNEIKKYMPASDTASAPAQDPNKKPWEK